MAELNIAVILLCLLACSNICYAGPSDPEPREEDWWWYWHELYVENTAANPNISIIFYGDSLTQFWNDEGLPLFNQLYAPLGAVNYGLGADRTQNLLWRIQNGELTGLNPKLIVLKIGLNNIWEDNLTEVADGIATVVSTFRQMLPNTKILLLSVLPASPGAGDGLWMFPRVYEVNMRIRYLSDEQNVFYFDMFDEFRASTWGELKEGYYTDGVHLSPAGYQQWANSMADIFNQLVQ